MKPLEEIKKMLTEISSWPWYGSEHIRFSINTETRHVAMVSSGRETEKEEGQNYANFRFILNSPQIISDLVQECERLQQFELQVMREQFKEGIPERWKL